jgi:hypothetical protein
MGDHVAGPASSSSEKPHNSFFPRYQLSSTFCPVEPFEKLKKKRRIL